MRTTKEIFKTFLRSCSRLHGMQGWILSEQVGDHFYTKLELKITMIVAKPKSLTNEALTSSFHNLIS